MSLDPMTLAAVVACALALAIVVFLASAGAPKQLAFNRRRPATEPGPSGLTRAASAATTAIARLLRRKNVDVHVAMLERAGLSVGLQDFVLMVIAAALAAGALGLLLGGPLAAVAFALVVPVGARGVLVLLAARRRSAFADQLDDSLQLIASSLRAGHSLLQSLAAVAREAEEPTREEFARIINETRVGRELAHALDETAARMGSADFVWVTEAIAINREVGGNLAEVLDGVGHTIRERNQIRRQVKALSAEGKLSAYVLMALPLGISAFLSMSNPEYMDAFTEGLVGYGLIGLSVVMLTIGALWLRKIVSFKF
ncbi:MAG TPA: type II secretion system F family protein [Propionibacteriaceae bacterium]|nr:type II secretion system F family protein [Propionibacteriaceae bacterium]